MSVHHKVAASQLCVGMYVVQLDRPWLETPFLFQGFYIRNEDEIRELQDYCGHVYVDPATLPELSQEPPTAPKAPPNGKANTGHARLATGARRFDVTGTYYRQTTGLKDEIRSAVRIREEAGATMQSVIEDVRRTRKLDIQKIETVVEPMVESVLRNPAAMACLARIRDKDNYLYQHCLATSVWAAVLGRHIGLDRDAMSAVATGAMLLDVGMTRVPDEILNKPGRLTEQQQELMRGHVQFGLDILDEAGQTDSRIVEMVENHHERYNGTGYPRGRKGNEIPVFGRIAGIVDSYDAMITKRSYADPISSYDALRQLRKVADVEFQAEIVDQFTQAIGAFPTGTLVELNTGEVGVVTAQNRIRRLRPEVLLIMDAEKCLLEDFRLINLDEETVSSDGRHSLWIERGLEPGAYGIEPSEFYVN